MEKSRIQIGIFAIGWSLLFLLVSVALRAIPSAAIAAVGLASASVFMALYRLRRGFKSATSELNAFGEKLKSEKDYRRFAMFAAGLGLAFIFQVINRYSSGPSGADTIFFLTTAPVFVLITALWNKDKPGWEKWIGLAAALAGGIMVLANWERPSSFSPFALFPREESLLMVSAFGLAVFAVVGRRLVKRYDPEILLTAAFWAVTPFGVLALAPRGIMSTLIGLSRESWLLGVMIGVLGLAVPLLCLLKALQSTTALSAVTAVCLMPALITSLIAAEKLSGFAALPTPFVITPVLAGIAVILIGVQVVWRTQKSNSPALEGSVSTTRLFSRGDHPAEIASLTSFARKDNQEMSSLANARDLNKASSQESGDSVIARPQGGRSNLPETKPRPLPSLLLVVALAQAVWAVIALFFTVESTAIHGTLDSGAAYNSVISTPGYNTIGGIILLIAGVVAVMAAFDLYKRKAAPEATAVWAAVTAALVVATFLSGKANIVSWLSSIPAEIQHAMGSAYVTVTETNVANTPLIIAYGFAAAFVLIALIIYGINIKDKS